MKIYLMLLLVIPLTACFDTSTSDSETSTPVSTADENIDTSDDSTPDTSQDSNDTEDMNPSENPADTEDATDTLTNSQSNHNSDTDISDGTETTNTASNDNDKNKESDTDNSTLSLAVDNMGRPVSKTFNGFTLTVVSKRSLSKEDSTSKDTVAVYGKINNENTGALLKINSNYGSSDDILVEIYRNGTLMSSHPAVLENGSNNIRYFGDVTVN